MLHRECARAPKNIVKRGRKLANNLLPEEAGLFQRVENWRVIIWEQSWRSGAGKASPGSRDTCLSHLHLSARHDIAGYHRFHHHHDRHHRICSSQRSTSPLLPCSLFARLSRHGDISFFFSFFSSFSSSFSFFDTVNLLTRLSCP